MNVKTRLPEKFEPMLATLGSMPEDQSPFGFEFKWDGYRAICFWNGTEASFKTRNHIHINHECGFLLQHRPRFKKIPAIFDGEIVARDPAGHIRFEALQKKFEFRKNSRSSTAGEMYYMVFDLPFLNGEWLTGFPFEQRRKLLEKFFIENKYWNLSLLKKGNGRPLLKAARTQKMEGVMAKRLDGLYYPGKRTENWIKIKFHFRQEFVIGGWTEGRGGASGGIGALLLGYFKDSKSKKLTYAGNVGTGFSSEDRYQLKKFLSRHAGERPFFENVPDRESHFSEPVAVAEIEFRGWTDDLKVRQASFKGLRIDKKPREVRREQGQTRL